MSWRGADCRNFLNAPPTPQHSFVHLGSKMFSKAQELKSGRAQYEHLWVTGNPETVRRFAQFRDHSPLLPNPHAHTTNDNLVRSEVIVRTTYEDQAYCLLGHDVVWFGTRYQPLGGGGCFSLLQSIRDTFVLKLRQKVPPKRRYLQNYSPHIRIILNDKPPVSLDDM
jgi:hypothetical protein